MTVIASTSTEQRPRDFAARLPRRVRGAGEGRRRHHGKRALALLAAIAVPALAAPGDWHTLAVGDADSAGVRIEPMPFERAGDSFPGSAFYYLAPDAQAQVDDMGAHSDAVDGAAGTARALRITGSFADQGRALTCLTQAIYYEAASEPDGGQRAVAQVVLNRVAHPAFPKTVCGVVYQGSERATGCQFTFTCDGALGRAPSRLFWQRAESVARAALAGYVYAPVGLATHYHTIAVHPAWDRTMALVQTIGAHQFFRLNGPAGSAHAFSGRYAGGEPVAVPRPRAGAPLGPDPALDPAAIERSYAASWRTTQEAGSAPAPVYSAEVQARGGDRIYRGDALPQATGVRPEYQDSGRWIAQPHG